jgi:hypothetical protein
VDQLRCFYPIKFGVTLFGDSLSGRPKAFLCNTALIWLSRSIRIVRLKEKFLTQKMQCGFGFLDPTGDLLLISYSSRFEYHA